MEELKSKQTMFMFVQVAWYTVRQTWDSFSAWPRSVLVRISHHTTSVEGVLCIHS